MPRQWLRSRPKGRKLLSLNHPHLYRFDCRGLASEGTVLRVALRVQSRDCVE